MIDITHTMVVVVKLPALLSPPHPPTAYRSYSQYCWKGGTTFPLHWEHNTYRTGPCLPQWPPWESRLGWTPTNKRQG
jgi:hypothetical protein